MVFAPLKKSGDERVIDTILAYPQYAAERVRRALRESGILPPECSADTRGGRRRRDNGKEIAELTIVIPTRTTSTLLPRRTQSAVNLTNTIQLWDVSDDTIAYNIHIVFELRNAEDDALSLIALPKAQTASKHASGEIKATTMDDFLQELVQVFKVLFSDWGGILALVDIVDRQEQIRFIYNLFSRAITEVRSAKVIEEMFREYVKRKLNAQKVKVYVYGISQSDVNRDVARSTFESPECVAEITLIASTQTENGEQDIAKARTKIFARLFTHFVDGYNALALHTYMQIQPLRVILGAYEFDSANVEVLGKQQTLLWKAQLRGSADALANYLPKQCSEFITEAIVIALSLA